MESTWEGMFASPPEDLGEPCDNECRSLEADCSDGGVWASIEEAGEALL